MRVHWRLPRIRGRMILHIVDDDTLVNIELCEREGPAAQISLSIFEARAVHTALGKAIERRESERDSKRRRFQRVDSDEDR